MNVVAERLISATPNRSTVNHRAADIVQRAAFSALDCGFEAPNNTQAEMGMHVGCAYDNEFGGDRSLLADQVRDALATLGFVW